MGLTDYELKYQRKWRSRDPKHIAMLQKKQRVRRRLKVMDAYGHQCACCGEKKIEFLCIDHINGGGTKERQALGKGGAQIYLYLIKMGFPKGYRILCHNCNMSLGFYGYCPHNGENVMAKVAQKILDEKPPSGD